MADIKFTFDINGTEWKEEHIRRLEYERNLHVLHQMKRHGIAIEENGKELSDDEIDYLSEEKAWAVSINTRAKYTGEDLKKIYADSLKLSDELWKRLAFGQDKPMAVSRCHMRVTGISLQNFMGVIRAMQQDTRVTLAAHPEHLEGIVMDTHLYVFEPFGMYGTPTFCEVKYADVTALGAAIQADRDPEYPISMAGRTFLADGVTEINSPYHQFKPLPDGFEAKPAVYWPENTPKEIVEGHCLHLAMEFYEGVKLMKQQGGTAEQFIG